MSDHVVVPTDRAMLPLARRALRSLVRHHPSRSLEVHLVHDGTIGARSDGTGSFADGLDPRLHAVEVPTASDGTESGTLASLIAAIPDLLVDVDRAVVLHPRSEVVRPADDLFETVLREPVAAVGCALPRRHWGRLDALRLGDPIDHFDIGVLLLDLVSLRDVALDQQAADVRRAFAPRLLHADREILNIVFAGRWQPIEPHFGVQHTFHSLPAVAESLLGPSVEAAARQPVITSGSEPEPNLRRRLLDRGEAMLSRAPRRVAGLVGPVRDAQARSMRRVPAPLSSASDQHRRIVARCLPHTMVSTERLLATIDATEHLLVHAIPGALVECGVWRGGSSLAMVLTLLEHGTTDRDVFLYDTFTGMTAPSDADTSRFEVPAATEWHRAVGAGEAIYAHLFDDQVFGAAQVERLLRATGYPPDRIHLVPGDVVETIPSSAPDEIALLRLDTDWYESTMHELVHLYPRLSEGAVLTIDDYGHWDGARRAVDEYFADDRPLLLRTDYSGRTVVKRGT